MVRQWLYSDFKQWEQCQRTRGIQKIERYAQRLTHRACIGGGGRAGGGERGSSWKWPINVLRSLQFDLFPVSHKPKFNGCFNATVKICITVLHILNIYGLLGQGMLLHGSSSLFEPSQSGPPFSGAGLVHSRLRFLVPPPHVTVQSPHFPQSDQFPFTVNKDKSLSCKNRHPLIASGNKLEPQICRDLEFHGKFLYFRKISYPVSSPQPRSLYLRWNAAHQFSLISIFSVCCMLTLSPKPKIGDFTLLFCGVRQKSARKCVLHVQHDIFAIFK